MSHRLTVDYAEDYELVKTIFESLNVEGAQPFSMGDILRFLTQHPDVARINAQFAGVNWYRNHLADLKTVSRRQTVTFEDD